MDKLFVYLTDLSGGAAYWIVFGILVACGLGLPLPEDIPLVASGYLAWEGTMSVLPAFLVTMTGVIVGDTILFFLGRRLAGGLLHAKKPVLFFTPKQIRRSRAYFRRYGDKVVFFARFVAGIRAVVFFMAGAMRMKYSRFIVLDGLAGLLSVPIWIAIGYGLGHYFGDEIGVVLQHVKQFKSIATAVIFGILAIVVLKVWYQVQQAKKKIPGKRAVRGA